MIYLINLMGMIFINMLLYFGHDSDSAAAKNYPTNIIPNFHAGHDSDSVAVYRLERYLLGTGPYWTTPHWLSQAEQIFDGQFYDQTTFHTQFPNLIGDTTWGSVNIHQGFEWFKYQIGPLDYNNLSTRLGDSLHSSHYYPLPARYGYYDFEEKESYDKNGDVTAYPSPATNSFSVKLKENCETDNLYIKCYDATGRDISHNFNIKRSGCIINYNLKNSYRGLVFIRILSDSKTITTVKVVLQ